MMNNETHKTPIEEPRDNSEWFEAGYAHKPVAASNVVLVGFGPGLPPAEPGESTEGETA